MGLPVFRLTSAANCLGTTLQSLIGRDAGRLDTLESVDEKREDSIVPRKMVFAIRKKTFMAETLESRVRVI